MHEDHHLRIDLLAMNVRYILNFISFCLLFLIRFFLDSFPFSSVQSFFLISHLFDLSPVFFLGHLSLFLFSCSFFSFIFPRSFVLLCFSSLFFRIRSSSFILSRLFFSLLLSRSVYLFYFFLLVYFSFIFSRVFFIFRFFSSLYFSFVISYSLFFVLSVSTDSS